MDMDKEQELRHRIANADPAQEVALPENLFDQARSRKPQRQPNPRSLQIGIGGMALASLALVSALTIPQLLKPAPLFTLAAGGSSINAAAETAQMAADAKATMYWPGYIEYQHTADGLSDQGGKGKIYQAQLVGAPTQILEKLMAYFGVSGEIKRDEWATDLYPSYSVQSKTGTVETYLSIYWSGTGNWNYSQYDSSLWACSATESSDSENQTEVCESPKPTPELIPTKEEMESQARAIFEGLGVTTAGLTFKSFRDDWGGSVYADMSHEGMTLPVALSVGWDSRGEISFVSGASFEMVERGEFNTVSPLEAMNRIKAGSWYGSPPSSYYENQSVGIARDSAIATEDIATEAVEAVDSIAVDEPAPDTPVEPQIVQLVVNRSEAAMLGVWDSVGGFWLVPGYVLFNDQGWFDSIIALEEGVIELPKYEEVMPLIEPAPLTKED